MQGAFIFIHVVVGIFTLGVGLLFTVPLHIIMNHFDQKNTEQQNQNSSKNS